MQSDLTSSCHYLTEAFSAAQANIFGNLRRSPLFCSVDLSAAANHLGLLPFILDGRVVLFAKYGLMMNLMAKPVMRRSA
jgi:hypothetical protein